MQECSTTTNVIAEVLMVCLVRDLKASVTPNVRTVRKCVEEPGETRSIRLTYWKDLEQELK
mgnify:CR=1 FL=1